MYIAFGRCLYSSIVVVGTPALAIYINGSLIPVVRNDGPKMTCLLGSLNLVQVHDIIQRCYKFVEEGAKGEFLDVTS